MHVYGFNFVCTRTNDFKSIGILYKNLVWVYVITYVFQYYFNWNSFTRIVDNYEKFITKKYSIWNIWRHVKKFKNNFKLYL